MPINEPRRLDPPVYRDRDGSRGRGVNAKWARASTNSWCFSDWFEVQCFREDVCDGLMWLGGRVRNYLADCASTSCMTSTATCDAELRI